MGGVAREAWSVTAGSDATIDLAAFQSTQDFYLRSDGGAGNATHQYALGTPEVVVGNEAVLGATWAWAGHWARPSP